MSGISDEKFAEWKAWYDSEPQEWKDLYEKIDALPPRDDRPMTFEDIEAQREKWARGELDAVPTFKACANTWAVAPVELERIERSAKAGDPIAVAILRHMSRNEAK